MPAIAELLRKEKNKDIVTAGLRCRIAVHRGPMMALTQAGRLDYFGQNVELALAVVAATPPAVVALTNAVCQEPSIAEKLHELLVTVGLVAAFRANPRAVSWGGGSAGGTDEVLVRLLADAVGVPRDSVNYIAYSGGGQALASVLGGHRIRLDAEHA